MLRKLISLLCVAAMLCAVVPCAYAYDTVTVDENQTMTIGGGNYDSITNNGNLNTSGLVSIDNNIENNGMITGTGDYPGLSVTGSITNSDNSNIDVFYITEDKIDGTGKSEATIDNSGTITTQQIHIDNVMNAEDGTISAEQFLNVSELNNEGQLSAGEIKAAKDTAAKINNSGTLEVQGAINAGTLTNNGTVTAQQIVATTVENYNTITEGATGSQTTYYGVSLDNGVEKTLASSMENGGKGVKAGGSFTVMLDTLADKSDAVFQGWQMNGAGEARVGEYSFTVNAATVFKALWAKITGNADFVSNILKWVDSEVKMVKDADGKVLEQGTDYSHVALTTAKQYVVLFSTDMLKAMGKGEYDFTIVMNDGAEIPYRLIIG